MSDSAQVTRAAGIVGAATLLSRIFGYLRDVVVAWFFGAGLASDAFFVAFRIPNLLRRLFAEGSLTVAFIPVFTEYLSKRGRSEAFRFARSMWWLLTMTLAAIALIGVLISPLIVKVIAPGFLDEPEKFRLTVLLTRIMFPYSLLIGLVALSMGILNALGHFTAPALAPVMLNVAMIGSVFMIAPHLEQPSTGLAIGVMIGGGLQLILQIPFLIRKGFRWFGNSPLYHRAVKRVAVLMTPTIFGAAVYQVTILVGTLLASLLPEGSVSYLYYADRLVQFPLGIFGIALATAVLPTLSRQAAAENMAGLRESFAYTLRLVFFVNIPAMVGLIVLREPIIQILFERGAFAPDATQKTAQALLYYALGLWAFSGVRIVVSTFYALQDTKTPVKVAVVSLLLNIVLSLILMFPMGHGGLALATSLAMSVNMILLIVALKKRLGRIGGRAIVASAMKAVVASIAMGIGLKGWVSWSDFDTGPSLLIGVLLSVIGGGLVYGFSAYLLKCREVGEVLHIVRSSGKSTG